MNEHFCYIFNFIFKRKTKMNDQSSSELNYQQFFKNHFSNLNFQFFLLHSSPSKEKFHHKQYSIPPQKFKIYRKQISRYSRY